MQLLHKLTSKLAYTWHLLRDYRRGWQLLAKVLQHQEIQHVALRSGVVISGGNSSQVLTVTDEIFIDRVYTPRFLPIEEGDIVVDIGANIGAFSVFACTQGAKAVYAYEPLAASVKVIKQNARQNRFSNLQVVQAAVSGKNGQAKLYLASSDVGNLLFDHNTQGKISEYVTVPTVTLTSIMKTHKLSHIDFLKIDCEGSEGAIVTSTSAAVWQKVDKIALEFHDNVSSLTHRQLAAKFKQLGFKTKVVATQGSPFGYVYAWRG